MKYKKLLPISCAIVLLLLAPLLAMQFTNEVIWTPFDFIIAAVLLIATSVLSQLILRKTTIIQYRICIFAIICILLVFVWAALTVGFFDTAFGGS